MAIKLEKQHLYSEDWCKTSEKTILQRGEVCEICHKKRNNEERYKGWLTVHHKNRNPSNNEEDNLIVVCPKCHFHLEYLTNRGHFNKDQLLLSL